MAIIVIPCSIIELGFSVWRDLVRAPYCSINKDKTTTFKFHNEQARLQGERVLQGALWVPEEA